MLLHIYVPNYLPAVLQYTHYNKIRIALVCVMYLKAGFA
jgi:hypothetical protein